MNSNISHFVYISYTAWAFIQLHNLFHCFDGSWCNMLLTGAQQGKCVAGLAANGILIASIAIRASLVWKKIIMIYHNTSHECIRNIDKTLDHTTVIKSMALIRNQLISWFTSEHVRNPWNAIQRRPSRLLDYIYENRPTSYISALIAKT